MAEMRGYLEEIRSGGITHMNEFAERIIFSSIGGYASDTPISEIVEMLSEGLGLIWDRYKKKKRHTYL